MIIWCDHQSVITPDGCYAIIVTKWLASIFSFQPETKTMLISSLLRPVRNWEGGVGNVLNTTRTIYFSWHDSFSELSVYVWSCDCYKFHSRKPQNSLFWNWNLQKRLPGSSGQSKGRLLSILRNFISHCVLRRPPLTSDTQHQAIQSTKQRELTCAVRFW